MNLTKILFRWFLYFLYLLITVVIIIEILFQTLPVSDSLKIQAVNENNPIMHFKKPLIYLRPIMGKWYFNQWSWFICV